MQTKLASAQPIQPAVRKEEMPKRFAKGRVCSNPGCTNPLSVYNGGVRCNPCLHDKDKERLIGSLVSVAELLEEAP